MLHSLEKVSMENKDPKKTPPQSSTLEPAPENEALTQDSQSELLENDGDFKEELKKLIEQNEAQSSAYKKILQALKNIQDSQGNKK